MLSLLLFPNSDNMGKSTHFFGQPVYGQLIKSLDHDKIVEIIAKEAKKRKDSLEDFQKSGREDLIEQINKEIEILNEYLPKQLTQEELEQKIKEIIAEVGATSIKDIGVVMKTAKEKIGATADGKAINETAKKILG